MSVLHKSVAAPPPCTRSSDQATFNDCKIQERYGVAEDEAEKQAAEWESKADESWFTKDKNRI